MARLLLQYLEPSDRLDAAKPAELAEHLSYALGRLPVSDVALGWRLGPDIVAAVRPVVPEGVTVWRWVPQFVDSGEGRAADALVAIGIDRRAPPPFRGLADFRFLCPDYDEVLDAALARSIELAAEVDADGVLLDRIRWHSPSRSPGTEPTCFCERSRDLARQDGLDLDAVAAEVATGARSLSGRRMLVAALLGRDQDGVLGEFLAWRRERVTAAVRRLADGLHDAGHRSALDVFTPALAHSVGQDLAGLADLGEWSKSMTYLDAIGPASMPFELAGYASWLEAAGEPDAAAFLSALLGFDAPGLVGDGAQLGGLQTEMTRLAAAVGAERSLVGIDAVLIPGVCDVSDADLVRRVAVVRDGGLGLAPSWDLLYIDRPRIDQLAQALQG